MKTDKKVYARLLLVGLLQCTAAVVLFYRSFIGVVVVLPYLLFFIKSGRKAHLKTLEWELDLQFCDSLQSLAASLEAGYSIENSVGAAINDLSTTYDNDAPIIRELMYIKQQLRNSISAEQAFRDFAQRSGIEDIQMFADILATAKRTGGDVINVIDTTARVIQAKQEMRREIRALIAAKRYEAMIMKIVPFGILLYLNVFCRELVAPLYTGVFGRVFMTLVLAVYLAACKMTERITDIEMQ